MAWTTPKTFVSGERLFAEDLNVYVSDNLSDLDPRTVKSFADSSARSTAIPSPATGAVTFLEDTDAVEVYDGSAWVSVSESPAVVQVVTATDSTDRTTTSTSYADASISVSITPTSASSTLYVFWAGVGIAIDTANVDAFGNLQITDSSNNALEGAEGAGNGILGISGSGAGTATSIAPFVLIGKVAAGNTSARTYKGRFKAYNATSFALRNSTNQTGRMIAIEVGA